MLTVLVPATISPSGTGSANEIGLNPPLVIRPGAYTGATVCVWPLRA